MSENIQKNPKPRFRTATENEKQSILDKRKAQNTNLATNQWITCLKEYLIEKQLPELDLLTNEQLGEILGNFYVEAKKKKVGYLPEGEDENNPESASNDNYKTTSLRAARGAFTRYFRDSRKIDIRTHPDFLESNEIFIGKTKRQ